MFPSKYTSTYSYVFNGKLHDDDIYGKDNSYDYGMRFYDPRLGRFMSIDPLFKKYPELSTYQFASNTPIWGVDWDGLEVRVYTETTGVGHSFVTVGTGNQLIVYTYGRYLGGDKGKSSSASTDPSGLGVLIKYTGAAAINYVNDKLKNKRAKVFEIKDADEKKVAVYYNNIFNSARKLTDDEAKKYNDHSKYGTAENARVVDKYGLLDNNCTTKAESAVMAGGTKEDFTQENGEIEGKFLMISPVNLQQYLQTQVDLKSSNVKDVTKDVQKEVTTSGANKTENKKDVQK